jgi:hypothetical protein
MIPDKNIAYLFMLYRPKVNWIDAKLVPIIAVLTFLGLLVAECFK